MDKYIKSANAIKEQIAFRFRKQSGVNIGVLESYKFLSLFENFDQSIRDSISKAVELNTNELPVLLMTLKCDEFVLVTTENIFIRSRGLLTSYPNGELESGTWDFLSKIHETGIERNLTRDETRNTLKMKHEGFELDFRLEFKNGRREIIRFPTGSATYSFMNTLNVIELVGRKYIIR